MASFELKQKSQLRSQYCANLKYVKKDDFL